MRGPQILATVMIPPISHSIVPPYFNDTRWRGTTMPSIFGREVVDGVGVMGILDGGGA